MPGMVHMVLDTEAMVDMVWDTVPMVMVMVDMLMDMGAMEDTGPTTLVRGLLILNLRLNLRLRLMPIPGMVVMDLDTEVMVDMVWDTVHMDILEDMEAMDMDPTTLERGLLILMLMPIMVMVWDTLVDIEVMGMVSMDMVLDIALMVLAMVMDTDVDIASTVESHLQQEFKTN